MKGIIFNAVEEAVVSLYSEEVWDDLIDAAGVTGEYTSLGDYDDADLFALVTAASSMTGIEAIELVKVLGRHSFDPLAERYSYLIDEAEGTLEFLRTVNDIIHPEVLKLHPNARPPSFEFEERENDILRVTYRSERKLGVLAQGLIYGAADRFGETVTVDVVSGLGDEVAVFDVSVEQAAAALGERDRNAA